MWRILIPFVFSMLTTHSTLAQAKEHGKLAAKNRATYGEEKIAGLTAKVELDLVCSLVKTKHLKEAADRLEEVVTRRTLLKEPEVRLWLESFQKDPDLLTLCRERLCGRWRFFLRQAQIQTISGGKFGKSTGGFHTEDPFKKIYADRWQTIDDGPLPVSERLKRKLLQDNRGETRNLQVEVMPPRDGFPKRGSIFVVSGGATESHFNRLFYVSGSRFIYISEANAHHLRPIRELLKSEKVLPFQPEGAKRLLPLIIPWFDGQLTGDDGAAGTKERRARFDAQTPIEVYPLTGKRLGIILWSHGYSKVTWFETDETGIVIGDDESLMWETLAEVQEPPME